MQTKPSLISETLSAFHYSLQDKQFKRFELFESQLLDRLEAKAALQQAEALQSHHDAINAHKANAATLSVLLNSMGQLEQSRSKITRTRQQLKGARIKVQPDRSEAMLFLITELSGGDRPAKELISLAQSIGILFRTLKRAKAELHMTSFQSALPHQSHCWVWSLAVAKHLTKSCEGGHPVWPREVPSGPQTSA